MDLNKDATEKEIKNQYKKLLLIVHPDKNKYSKSNETFKKFIKAYNVLSNKN